MAGGFPGAILEPSSVGKEKNKPKLILQRAKNLIEIRNELFLPGVTNKKRTIQIKVVLKSNSYSNYFDFIHTQFVRFETRILPSVWIHFLKF